MKKKTYFIIFFFSVLIAFLASESSRYTGINYVVSEEKISNFQKIEDFLIRHKNYKNLVKNITDGILNDEEEIIEIASWVYENIKKISNNQEIIDSHPWTIVERKLGTQGQFSDILSVLLVHKNIDSFYLSHIKNIDHDITFFKFNDKWSIIDPYYGIYFRDKEKLFSTLDQDREKDWIIHHLSKKKVNKENFKTFFFDEKFQNFEDFQFYYINLVSNLPSNHHINEINIYERGGRAHLQKPIHRIIYQLRVISRFFFY